jgi:hypothetical protein
LGFIRLAKVFGGFEMLKPELRHFPHQPRTWVKQSFCRPKHWLTMSCEMLNLNQSSREVSVANDFGSLPIVSIKARSFFKASFWTFLLPRRKADELRDEMHEKLGRLSTDCLQLNASNSDHFVWIDQSMYHR